MDLQYIYDTSVSPPARSTLMYSISPETFRITQSDSTRTVVSLTLLALNNSNRSVDCSYIIFGLPQGEPSGELSGAESEPSPAESASPVPLTARAANLPASTDEQEYWNNPVYQPDGDPAYPDYYLYKATPKTDEDRRLARSQALSIMIHNVEVVKSKGIPQLMIREMVGGKVVTGFIPVQILDDKQLQIAEDSFQAAPSGPMNPGDKSVLTWAVFNADHWKLYNADQNSLLYEGNQQTFYNIEPLNNSSYKLIAYADDDETNHVTASTEAQVNPVMLTTDINDGGHSVSVDAQMTAQIYWRTQLANRVKLHASDGTPDQIVDASKFSGVFYVTPTQDTNYTLSAYYEDDTQSPPLVSKPVTNELYIGINPPRINRFNASQHVPCNGAPITLTWQIESAFTCTIEPGVGTFEGWRALEGSIQITPPEHEQTTYTLTAHAGSHQTKASIIIRPQESGFYVGVTDSAYQYSDAAFGLVYQEQFWMIDAYGGRIWKSPDGVNWSPVESAAPWKKLENGAAAVFGDSMWLMGGRRDGLFLNEVWRCSDPAGAQWELVETASIWYPRRWHQCQVFQNKLWVIGGEDSTGKALNDVYSSVDGINWSGVTFDAGWPARIAFNSGVLSPRSGDGSEQLWICAGFDAEGELLNDAWYSTDGLNWTQWSNTNMKHWSPRWNALFQSTGDKLWMCSGTDDDQNPTSDLWYITGPHDYWHPVGGTPDWKAKSGEAQLPGATCYFDGRIWLFGTAQGWGGNPYIWYFVPPYP